MKRVAIVSYNIYCNFTNYGSALQTYALHQVINHIAPQKYESIVLDYCPDVHLDKDILNPMKAMWDVDQESLKMCELSMPAIRINNDKFNAFYKSHYDLSHDKYTYKNYNDSLSNENLDGYVCGSDTIFCIEEFGFDNAYYANYEVMQGRSVAYAASFGDSRFDEKSYPKLNALLKNFKAIGLRENTFVDYVREQTPEIPVERVLDPTLLLSPNQYEPIIAERQSEDKYILLYARRYNPKMEAYAERLAQEKGWKIIEISLRATNASRHRMFYDAGVEEFLSLVKHAEFVVTNSFHGVIFSVQFQRPFYVFSREQADTKILELLGLFGIQERLRVTGEEPEAAPIDYDNVHQKIAECRKHSLKYLETALDSL